MALPWVALPPLTWLRRDFARKKKMRSKMNASSVMAAPRPDMHEEKQDMENSLTWARRPNIEEIAARTRATMCRTRA
jgi:hypothetical protein